MLVLMLMLVLLVLLLPLLDAVAECWCCCLMLMRDAWCWMLDADAECLMLLLNAECWMLNAECLMLDAWCLILNAECYCQLSNQNDNEWKRKKKPSSDLSAIHIHTSGRVASPPATIVHKFGSTTTLTRLWKSSQFQLFFCGYFMLPYGTFFFIS